MACDDMGVRAGVSFIFGVTAGTLRANRFISYILTHSIAIYLACGVAVYPPFLSRGWPAGRRSEERKACATAVQVLLNLVVFGGFAWRGVDL